MDFNKLFELAIHMNENPGEPYRWNNEISLNEKQQINVLKKAIQGFVHKTGVMRNKRIIQAFSGSSALPVLTKDVFNVTQKTPSYDLLWQKSYKGIQLRKGQLSWEISDVEDGMAFELVPEGGSCKFYGVSGSTQVIGIQKYAAGIGLTWEIREGRKLYKFIDLLLGMRTKLYELWADIHYGLLAAACLVNQIAWQGVVADPILERDIATINLGYETIGEATKDSGCGDTANVPMLLYASPKLKARINQAMRATSADIIAGRQAGAAGSKAGQIVEYNVEPNYTWNGAIPLNKALMVLPENKIQNAVYLENLGLSETDIKTLSELRAYWTAFGAVIGDTDQCVELAFA